MNKSVIRNVVTGILIAGLASACTWVPLETHGATVEVASRNQDLSSCQKLGETTVSVKHKIWFYERNQSKVNTELENLARNEAAEQNADTVQAIAPASNGKQAFRIYDCLV